MPDNNIYYHYTLGISNLSFGSMRVSLNYPCAISKATILNLESPLILTYRVFIWDAE